MNFDQWAKLIVDAYGHARTPEDAYELFIKSGHPVDDHAVVFFAGWVAACDAVANQLVDWEDERAWGKSAGDPLTQWLVLVREIREGRISGEDR